MFINFFSEKIFEHHLRAISFTLVFLFLLLASNTTFAQKCIYVEPETTIQFPTIVTQENMQKCSFEEVNEIEKAKSVLKNFWVFSRKKEYELFSESFNKRLKIFHHIKNSDEYIKKIPITELHWTKQIYQRYYMEKDKIEVVILANWFEEGNEGVMSFTFTLIKEKGDWKISEVKF